MPSPRCRLSAHAAAPISFDNQGFAFSRCRRCGVDLIRSASLPNARWTKIPSGFRVAWRASDTTAFVHLSDTHRLLAAAAQFAATAKGTAWLAVAIANWWLASLIARAKRRIASVRWRSRALGLPGQHATRDRLVVMITLTVVRERVNRGEGRMRPDSRRASFTAWRYPQLRRPQA